MIALSARVQFGVNKGRKLLPYFSAKPSSMVGMDSHRHINSIRFFEEKRSGEEAVYFKKEDEVVLKNLLSNHPEYDPKYMVSSQEKQTSQFAQELTLVLQKHGFKENLHGFSSDIIKVFEKHGWQPPKEK